MIPTESKGGRVLERFLSGDLEGARASLVQAQSENRYVKDYLTGIKALPRRQPDSYSPGDKREACVCVAGIGDAWRNHPRAIEWLCSVHLANKRRPTTKKQQIPLVDLRIELLRSAAIS